MLYHVSVSWTVAGSVDIEADSVEQAQWKADQLGLSEFGEVEYVDDSFRVDAVNWPYHN